MKNKENIIGWILIVLITVGFVLYNQQLQEKKLVDEKTTVKEKKSTDKQPGSFIIDTTKITAAKIAPDSSTDSSPFIFSTSTEDHILENDNMRVTIASRGGRITAVELKNYKTWDKKPLLLMSPENSTTEFIFPTTGDKMIYTGDLYFKATSDIVKVSGDQTGSITLRAETKSGGYIQQKYSLKGKSYQVEQQLSFSNMQSVVAQNATHIELNWKSNLPRLEQNIQNERRYASVYLKNKSGDVEHLSQEESEERNVTTSVDWISFKHQFFNATILPEKSFSSATVKVEVDPKDESYMKKYSARANLPYQVGQDNQFNLSLYFGPSHYATLKATGKDLESILHLGPDFWMFSWIKYITRFIFIPLFNFFDQYQISYGVIILIMTLLLKIALHPLTYKSLESAAKMKVLGPELQEIRDKYKDDQAKLGQEQMKLYSRAGVSPLGGCLPLLLQFPILMAMYYFFPSSIELRQQSFLWATDLSSYDAIVTFKQSLPLIGNHLSLFTILMTVTSLIQAWQNSGMNQMNAQPGMQYFPYIMPVMLMFMFNSFPAALTYYYLLQNLLGVVHQWVIQKFFIDEAKLHQQIQNNKNNPKPKSGFQKKLEDFMKETEKKQKERKKK
jgi:YidC/Oxa1 family membrane protein insertase